MKLAVAVALLVLPTLRAAEAPRVLAPSRHHDLAGREVAIPDPTAKATVLLFLSTTCPICRKYAPELQRIAGDYGRRGIRILLVQIEADLKNEDAKRHAQDFGLTPPTILDPRHSLAKSNAAKITPEAVVLSPDGRTLYRGRIDDRFPTVGKDSLTPRSYDLRRALDEILAGKPVSQPVTAAVGCHIE